MQADARRDDADDQQADIGNAECYVGDVEIVSLQTHRVKTGENACQKEGTNCPDGRSFALILVMSLELLCFAFSCRGCPAV